jgi:hypothetical protein
MHCFKFIIIAAIVVFHSCSNNKKSNTADEKAGKKDTALVNNNVTPTNNNTAFHNKKEELEKLTPLKAADIEKLLPVELMGAPRMDVNNMEYAGTYMASATYQLNEQSDIALTIVDCGGPAGAGLYGVQFLEFLGREMKEGGEYTKTISLNGTQALEHCDQKANDCSIIWFTGGRFLVTLQADGASLETLKQASRAVKL